MTHEGVIRIRGRDDLPRVHYAIEIQQGRWVAVVRSSDGKMDKVARALDDSEASFLDLDHAVMELATKWLLDRSGA